MDDDRNRLDAGQGVDGCSYWMPELPGAPDFLSKQGLAIFSLDPARVFIAWGLVLKPSRFMDDCSLSLRLYKEPDAAAREAALTLMRGATHEGERDASHDR